MRARRIHCCNERSMEEKEEGVMHVIERERESAEKEKIKQKDKHRVREYCRRDEDMNNNEHTLNA